MARAGDGGGEYHQLDGAQRLLNHNNEELYERIEGLENQLTQNARRPNGGNKGGNDGSRQNKLRGKTELRE